MRSVSSITGKSTAQGRPFFVITTDFFRWQFLNDLAQLGLNCAQTFDLHNSNRFPLSTRRCLFCVRPAQRYPALEGTVDEACLLNCANPQLSLKSRIRIDEFTQRLEKL